MKIGMVRMDDRAFVDTNILIRATLQSAPFHHQARSMILNLWDQDVELWISRQVLREYIANVTRPQTYIKASLHDSSR